jgi:aminoglycoside N3'-acetyltransferase
MQTFLYNFLRKVLKQNSRDSIKSSIFKIRNRYKNILRFIYGTANDDDIFNNIREKLGDGFDVLMIHSSFNDMIPMYTGNLNKLLSEIISFCEQNNITLAMPAFFFGADNFNAKEYYKKNSFDVKKTVSQMGLLTELFRRLPNVRRSIHPTHSICALGALAEKLTKNHHLTGTACGEGTPYGEMRKYRTLILGIGAKGFRTLTQIHSAEDIMKNEFPIAFSYSEIIPVTCIDELGNSLIYNLRIQKPQYRRDASMVNRILGQDKLKEWTYKGIPFFLTTASIVTDTFIEAAKKGTTIYQKI